MLEGALFGVHPKEPVTVALNGMPGAGFEPAKLYAEDLESTPFDRSGTPACGLRLDLMFLTIALHRGHPVPQVVAEASYVDPSLCPLVSG